MEMKKYIEIGEKKAGKQKDLALILAIKDNHLRNAKSGRSGLPIEVCIKLADYINEDRLKIIAASNLVTEKNEEKRSILKSCFKYTSKAASIALLIGVTSIMSPPPANAAISPAPERNIYIMLNRIEEIGKEGSRTKFKVIVITCGFHCNRTTISIKLVD